MSISPRDPVLHALQLENFQSYLGSIGWKPVEPSNTRWLVFEGGGDINGNPVEIVFPNNPQASDMVSYFADAIDLLSALTSEVPENIANRIRSIDRDILRARTLDSNIEDSIALRLAAQQVSDLKQLVNYSACSEREPRPYFATSMPSAKSMLDHYQFAHTFRGSFGFTIESRIVGTPFKYAQRSLLPEVAQDIIFFPKERRVMERIVRGLLAAQQAARAQEVQVLVENYADGFNANMCQAIVHMSDRKTLSLEYTVQWSPKLEPSDDVKTPGPIRLRKADYDSLDEAAGLLKALQPEYVTIQGTVDILKVRNDPLSASARDRTVAVHWINRPNGRPIDVFLALDRDSYILAHQAQLNWATIEVTGKLERTGNIWHLVEPQGFKIVH